MRVFDVGKTGDDVTDVEKGCRAATIGSGDCAMLMRLMMCLESENTVYEV